MPAPGSQHDLNTGSVGPAQGIQVGVGHLDLGVQQRAIYINGDEANAALHELILAAVRYQLVNGRGFQPKHGEATNGKLFYKVFVAGGAGGCRIANNRVDCGPATAVAFSLTGCHSCPGSSAEANGKFNPMLWRLWETNMQDQRWLAPVLFCLLIPHAQAQVGGSGSVHMHIVYADDRRASSNLLVRLMQG